MNKYCQLLKNYMIINRSGLFDPDYYNYLYPDVYKSGINPLIHFIRFGWREGRSPSISFDTNFYLSQNNDVKKSDINPLTHWILHGLYEGRDPAPCYSSPIKNGEADKFELYKRWKQYISFIYQKKNVNLKPQLKDFSFRDDKKFIDHYYENVFGKTIDYIEPRTFTEKIQIYKLYYRKPLLTDLTDKYKVREYIREKIGNEYLIPLIGFYENPDEIPIKDLPEKFILKTNHGSGWNIFCWDNQKFDWGSAKLKLKYWLNLNYYRYWREWNYKNIKPGIIIEDLLLDCNHQIPPDLKIHCFNGQPKMVECHINRLNDHRAIFLDMEWRKLPFNKSFPTYEKRIPKPKNLTKSIELAKKLSQNMPFMRVDTYLLNDKFFIGELTFYPGSGFSKFNPPGWDDIIGGWFDISSFFHYKNYLDG